MRFLLDCIYKFIIVDNNIMFGREKIGKIEYMIFCVDSCLKLLYNNYYS
ncbi:hypothetical protein [Tepidibacter mesophilus]|nr:hypothetical protein [Tepidibacter mesophilus]